MSVHQAIRRCAALLLAIALPGAAHADDGDTLLGDAAGLRPALARAGITLQLLDQEEIWANAAGGLKRGASYNALTTLTLQLDTDTAFHWPGGTVNLSALQIRGRNFSQSYLGNLQTASGIAAQPTTRLWEAWVQQTLPRGADLRIGLQSLDQEFMTSAGSSLFLNTMAGWPMLPSADLYAGGPAYPLSSLGVRLRLQPGGGFTALAGVFQDNPPGGPFANDDQLRGSSRWGGNFNLRTGALFIAELQYALNPPAETGTGLPGTYKLGAWFDTAAFPDQRLDDGGLSLADPASSANPRLRRGNYSFYAVADQMIWRPDPQSPRALSLFLRAMGTPSGDRNLVDFSINGGVTLKAPLPGRDDDSLGIGFGVARVGPSARRLDRDIAALRPGGLPTIRSSETFVELTYQAQITPWLQLQPDIQLIARPGGGTLDLNDGNRRIRDEAVFGLRTNITF